MKKVILFFVLFIGLISFSQTPPKSKSYNTFTENGGDVWVLGRYVLAGGIYISGVNLTLEWGGKKVSNNLNKCVNEYFVVKLKYNGGNYPLKAYLGNSNRDGFSEITSIIQSKTNPYSGKYDSYEWIGNKIK